jgi:ParB family chromosome partitioning protein
MTNLTTAEKTRLTHLEKIIRRGLNAFIDVGSALTEIRTRKLYRQEYGTFEDYCQDKWNMGRAHANRLIEAVGIYNRCKGILEPMGAKINERILRPLAGLDEPMQYKALGLAMDIAKSEGKLLSSSHTTRAAKRLASKKHPAHGSGCYEWYTPGFIIDLARKVLGKIDLDPASCETANKVVEATRYFTEEDDGLVQEWKGRVWLNPPYLASSIIAFTDKLVHEYLVGNIEAAILLCNAATDTNWWQHVSSVADRVAFPNDKVKFWADDRESQLVQPQSFMYFGQDVDKFRSVFGQPKVGTVLRHRVFAVTPDDIGAVAAPKTEEVKTEDGIPTLWIYGG